jgi:hypothetical protein
MNLTTEEALAAVVHRHNLALAALFALLAECESEEVHATTVATLETMAVAFPFDRFCAQESPVRRAIERKKAQMTDDEWELQMAPFLELERYLASLRQKWARKKQEQETQVERRKRHSQDGPEIQ